MTNRQKNYIFDFDNNLIHMPTKVKVNYKWNPIKIATHEYAEISKWDSLKDPYKIRQDTFDNFKDDKKFQKDLIEAIKSKSLWPSYQDFKEAILNISSICIITARWNSRKAIKNWLFRIILNTFSEKELNQLHKKLKEVYRIKDFARVLSYYLSGQFVYPVTSQDWEKQFPKHLEKTVAQRKLISFKEYIENIFTGNEINIWFSDDDHENLLPILNYIQYIQKDKNHDKINFYLYNTKREKIEIS